MGNRQAYRQHHAEGQQVLEIADRERKARRHEKEIERSDAEQGDKDCRPATKADGDQYLCQQIQHDDVGQVEKR